MKNSGSLIDDQKSSIYTARQHGPERRGEGPHLAADAHVPAPVDPHRGARARKIDLPCKVREPRVPQQRDHVRRPPQRRVRRRHVQVALDAVRVRPRQAVPGPQARPDPGEGPRLEAAPGDVGGGAVGLDCGEGRVGEGARGAVAAEAVDAVEDGRGVEAAAVLRVVERPVPEGLGAAVPAFFDQGGFVGPDRVSVGVRMGI